MICLPLLMLINKLNDNFILILELLMINLQKILTDNKPVYEYRIKFATEPSTEDLSKITQRLTDRYDAFEIGAVKKTIFMDKPLDFYDMDCGEIWMFDFKCNRGVQTNVLTYEIGNLLSMSEALIRVRSKDSPTQIEMSIGEDDIDFDTVEVIGVDVGAAVDSTGIAGQERADQAVKDSLKASEEVRVAHKKDKYTHYMSAAFGNKE